MPKSVIPTIVPVYTKLGGRIYDLIYSDKDYGSESDRLYEIIREYSKTDGNNLLEAACGTGIYMMELSDRFEVEGFDLSPEQVMAAKLRLPNSRIIQADMLDFDMQRQYDAILCLFSSIGYLVTKENLDKAIANFSKHLKPGGVLIVESWLQLEEINPGHISTEVVDNDGLSVSRMGMLTLKDGISIVDMHHMIGTEKGIEHYLEIHKMAIYTDDDYTDAFFKSGLSIEIDPEGITSRRLYVGTKSL